jgi:hypothetical protein
MAQFTFKVVDGLSDIGTEAIELESVVAARDHLVRFASDILRDYPELVWGADLQVQVANADGCVLFSLISVGIKAPIVGTPGGTDMR